MNKALEREWYLEIHGIKTGPYSPEQVQGLLEEGEVLVTTAVFHGSQANLPSDKIEWFTAGEFVNGFRDYISSADVNVAPPTNVLPTNNEMPLDLPESDKCREASLPKSLQEENTHDLHLPSLATQQTPVQVPTHAPEHAIDDLFETLLLARDRKNQTHKMTPPNPEEWGTLSRSRTSVTPTVAFAVALGLVFLLAIWGMVTIFKHSSSNNSPNASTITPEEKKSTPSVVHTPPPAVREVIQKPRPSGLSPLAQPRHPEAPVRAPVSPAVHENKLADEAPTEVPVPLETTDGQTAHFEGDQRLDGTGPNPENTPVNETPPTEVAPQQFQ